MAEKDKGKTAFITESSTYHYNVMPFGLKNAGATYQRLVNKIFKRQVGRNIEVYVDDMLVKSTEEANHIQDLKETSGVLRQYQIRSSASISNEAQSLEVPFRSRVRQVPWIHDHQSRNRSQPRKDTGQS